MRPLAFLLFPRQSLSPQVKIHGVKVIDVEGGVKDVERTFFNQ